MGCNSLSYIGRCRSCVRLGEPKRWYAQTPSTLWRLCHAGGSLLDVSRRSSRGMRKTSYAGYRFPPEVIDHAIWLYLWTVPAMQGLLRQFGQRSAATIYSVFGATSLPTLMRYADWRPIILAGLGAR